MPITTIAMKFALALVLALASSASAFNGLNFGGRGRGGIRRSIRKSPFNNKGGFGTGGNIGGNGQPPINNDKGGLNADASGDVSQAWRARLLPRTSWLLRDVAWRRRRPPGRDRACPFGARVGADVKIGVKLREA